MYVYMYVVCVLCVVCVAPESKVFELAICVFA